LLPHPDFDVHLLNAFDFSGSSNPDGLTPNQVRGAYGLGTYNSSGVLGNAITFHGIQGDGSGQTIAIIAEFDDPNALSDLNAFSAYYNLPQFNTAGGPTFQKLDQYGGTTRLPRTDPSGPSSSTGNDTWEMEESLDIEWAHVMAPMANIDLFEAQPSGLYTAVNTVANMPGINVVSMSWSADESSIADTIDDSFFESASVQGVTFLAAAGDYGAYSADNTTTITPQYPACSPYVVAVGGTTLTVSGSDPNYTYGSETTWGNGTLSGTSGDGGGGGGGISHYEHQPSYQEGVVNAFSTTRRTYPDVSADANPNTAVPIYDSWDFGASTPWLSGTMGGTSLSCPLWAGMVAIADQGRSIAGLPSLGGFSQTLPALYSLPSADFHDITSGNSIGPSPKYSPGTGYDLATGLGSPVGSLLIPQLAGPSILAFAQGPTSAVVGASITPSITVDVEDALGNVVTSDNSDVTLSVGNNPSGGSLQGTLTVAAVNGVATFSGLDIDTLGNGYTLIASDGGLSSATSAAFNITADLPLVATPAAASASPVTGQTVSLSVLGGDPTGEANLIYTWSTSTLSSGASSPTFSANQTNAAKNTTATFSSAGTYVFLVAITNASGLSTTSSVSVTVDQTLTSFSITAPPTVGSGSDGAGSFVATALDQFGIPLASQSQFPWSVSDNGIDFDSTTGATVNLDGESPSFADVMFSGTGYTIAQHGSGGTLQLANGANSATLTIAAGSDTISAPVALQSNVNVLPAAGSQLTISGGIGGAGQSLSVNGQGTVVLSGANSYTGGTTVSAGTLVLANSSAIPANTSLTVGAGGILIFDPSVAAPPPVAAPATTPAIASSTNTTVTSNHPSVATPDVGELVASDAAKLATSAATSSDASMTTIAPSATGVALKNDSAGDSTHFPIVPPATPVPWNVVRRSIVPAVLQSPRSVSAGALNTPAAGRIVGTSVAKKVFGDMAWLGQITNSSDNSDLHHRKDLAIRALEAVFAQFGR
jgi:autotransporter-associated beta strand protein